MAVTLVQGSPVRTGAFSGSSTASLAYSSAVTSGNTLVLFFSGNDGQTTSSVDDNVNSGTWTQAGTATVGGVRSYIFYRLATASGTPTVTAHLSGSSLGCQLTLFEISGTSLAKDVAASNNAGTGVSDAGNLNTSFANAFLLAGTENLNSESTVGSSMTFLQSANGNAFASCQYRIVSSTSNYATAFGTDTAGNWAAVAVAIGESSGGAAKKVLDMIGFDFIPRAR